MTSFSDVIEQVPFLRNLGAEDQRRLATIAQRRTVARGEAIWRQGEPTRWFTFLVKGRAKLVSTGENGRDAIVGFCEPGDLLCAGAVCTFAPYCCGAVAANDAVEVLLLPRRETFELLEQSSAVARAMLFEVTSRTMGLCRRVEELSAGRVSQRVAKLLLRLTDRLGLSTQGEGLWVPFPIPRQDLADLCGTTVESASREISRMRRAGVLATTSRGFRVRDRAALERVARGERE